jgi:hypothetical protein
MQGFNKEKRYMQPAFFATTGTTVEKKQQSERMNGSAQMCP